MSAFVFNEISKSFVSRSGLMVEAVRAVSFAASAGKVTCILGPTGSGKSTLLRLAAGLDRADRGVVSIGGSNPQSLRGRIGYLTQRHTLFPWLRLWQNIALPLEVSGASEEQMRRAAQEICGPLGLSGALDLYPYELSGGMQQRAALGRLLAMKAPYWLVDEPFNSLDERTQQGLQRELLRLVDAEDISVLFVTHNIDEALFLADRIILLSASPGTVAHTLDLDTTKPRDRMSREYGLAMEDLRRRIVDILS